MWIAFIEFTSGDFRWWSAFTFWTVVISLILTLGFTVVVFFGGLADLKYLISAMDEERVDETDDGRVLTASAEHEGGFEVLQKEQATGDKDTPK